MNPRLEELLSEPIIRLLMQSDGVDAESLRALICRTARNLRQPPP